MALTATAIKREFVFNGTKFPDPNPEASIDTVRDILANTHSEIATAAIDGPNSKPGGIQSYTFVKSVGTKG
jgi:PRTRC genetic system protein C